MVPTKLILFHFMYVVALSFFQNILAFVELKITAIKEAIKHMQVHHTGIA